MTGHLFYVYEKVSKYSVSVRVGDTDTGILLIIRFIETRRRHSTGFQEQRGEALRAK